MVELSIGARKQAVKLQARLRRGEAVVLLSGTDMGRRKGLAQLQRWCDEQGIGQPRRSDGGWRFDEDTLQQLQQALHILDLAPLDSTPATTRIGRVQQGAQEYKTLGEAPLAQRILCSFRLASEPVATTQIPPRWVLDMDWRHIDTSAYAGLLVVENADVFYACDTPDWPLPNALTHYLVAYRGHDYRAKGLKALQQTWRDVPQIYFGDVDPKGMRIALQEGYSHVLLPVLGQFRRAATARHAPVAQETSQRWLAARLTSQSATAPLCAYLRVLVDGKGLLQQAMVRMPLTIVPIA